MKTLLNYVTDIQFFILTMKRIYFFIEQKKGKKLHFRIRIKITFFFYYLYINKIHQFQQKLILLNNL